jgi:endogenous inhibitor of DNA gyrase (YacG/DUF329 family)
MTDKDIINDEEGDFDEDVYSEEGLEEETDSDAIRPVEEGVMGGYEDKEDVKCAGCNKILADQDDVVEEKIKGKIRRFCSNRCAERFAAEKRMKKGKLKK